MSTWSICIALPKGETVLARSFKSPEQALVYASSVIDQPDAWEDVIGTELVEHLSKLAPEDVEVSIVPSE
jgi:hypothetical protein